MTISNDVVEMTKDIVHLCKEKEYNRLADLIHESYVELVKVEAESRRMKSSIIIKGIQILDLEMYKLKIEYDRLKRQFNITEISALDCYIKEIKAYRRKLVIEKNNFS
ncbi:conserved protein of unknown function [Petrocella atlantisensis]|uniref:Uncharacterized protein n=1 Tax=Petrocella atlantisensis TaxID=2173034 RepID=A0A3P7P191_9FIRM|nr:hypothetical protein [Petrocella atlantisensis]VDN47240.1 conserved protein of unknown function [Petrocella atlantisensis]